MQEKIVYFLLKNRVPKPQKTNEHIEEKIFKKEDYRMYMLGKLLGSKRKISNEKEVVPVEKERIDCFFTENIIDYIKRNRRKR